MVRVCVCVCVCMLVDDIIQIVSLSLFHPSTPAHLPTYPPTHTHTYTGYIDLSKRRVSPDDVIKCEERYNKAKAVHSVLRHVADQHGLWLEDLYKKVGWPLYRKHGHAFDAFSKYLL